MKLLHMCFKEQETGVLWNTQEKQAILSHTLYVVFFKKLGKQSPQTWPQIVTRAFLSEGNN